MGKKKSETVTTDSSSSKFFGERSYMTEVGKATMVVKYLHDGDLRISREPEFW